jgi:hypothetical protein
MTYTIEGHRRRTGAIGIPENFTEKVEATSSREAYVQVCDATYNDGYEHILVKAIKMKCEHCGKGHILVDPQLYLYE